MKNHHISEAGVSFENIVWSVYQDMDWRTHFYVWQQTIALKKEILKELLNLYVPFKMNKSLLL